jgi:hypothetical protein
MKRLLRLRRAALHLPLVTALLLHGCGGGGRDAPPTITPAEDPGTPKPTTAIDINTVTQLDALQAGANQAIQLAEGHVDTVASAAQFPAVAPASTMAQAQSASAVSVLPQTISTFYCTADPKTGQIGTVVTETITINDVTTSTKTETHCNGASTVFIRNFWDGVTTTKTSSIAAPTPANPNNTDLVIETSIDRTGTWIASPIIGNDVVQTRTFKGSRRCLFGMAATQCVDRVGEAAVSNLGTVTTTSTQTRITRGTVKTKAATPSLSLDVAYTNWFKDTSTGESSGTVVVTDSVGTVANVEAKFSEGKLLYTVVITKAGSSNTYVFTNATKP